MALRCGLSSEFLRAPESFNVGKGGRNLTLRSRQAISIARGLLSDADVLMLHKPAALLGMDARANRRQASAPAVLCCCILRYVTYFCFKASDDETQECDVSV